MAQITKEELIKKNAELEKGISFYKNEDERLRTVFSELLGSYKDTNDFGYSRKSLDVQSWEGIAFMIGELKSDADYSLCLEREKGLRDHVNHLNEHIHKLESSVDDKKDNQ